MSAKKRKKKSCPKCAERQEQYNEVFDKKTKLFQESEAWRRTSNMYYVLLRRLLNDLGENV